MLCSWMSSLNLGQAFPDIFAFFAFLSILISLIFSLVSFPCFCQKRCVQFCLSECFLMVPVNGKPETKFGFYFGRNLHKFTDLEGSRFFLLILSSLDFKKNKCHPFQLKEIQHRMLLNLPIAWNG